MLALVGGVQSVVLSWKWKTNSNPPWETAFSTITLQQVPAVLMMGNTGDWLWRQVQAPPPAQTKSAKRIAECKDIPEMAALNSRIVWSWPFILKKKKKVIKIWANHEENNYCGYNSGSVAYSKAYPGTVKVGSAFLCPNTLPPLVKSTLFPERNVISNSTSAA